MCHGIRFVAKPDSPCIYMEGNSGPDGCAIFYRGDKFSCESWHSRVLQVWRVESNQVSCDWCRAGHVTTVLSDHSAHL